MNKLIYSNISISCHITPLANNSLRGRPHARAHTHTHTHTHAHTHTRVCVRVCVRASTYACIRACIHMCTHTNFPHKSNFKKPGMLVFSQCIPSLKCISTALYHIQGFFMPLNFHEFHKLFWICEIKFTKCCRNFIAILKFLAKTLLKMHGREILNMNIQFWRIY